MNNRDDLVSTTKEFFDCHWGLSESAPTWDFSWGFKGPVPNYLVGGVYALMQSDLVVYVGLASSRGGGIYKDRGISRRLMTHVLLKSPSGYDCDYILRERWLNLGIDKVATLGFEMSKNYLAPALEDFLIGRLCPPENIMKRMKS